MALATFEDFGVRIEYPDDWESEVTDEGDEVTVAVNAPDGLAFALVTLDESRPAPAEVADEALRAMREEYPTLDATPAREDLDGHRAVGFDVEFFALDMTNGCAIRAFRTPRRTVLIFSQWSDVEAEEIVERLTAIRRSVAETDSAD